MLQFQIDRVDYQIGEDRSQIGIFVIGPLDRGQATTLGTALRRVLMSGLEGTAVTAVRISGVNHEYATVPGVREDVLDILLNCKELILNSRSRDTEIGRLVAHGSRRSLVLRADQAVGPIKRWFGFGAGRCQSAQALQSLHRPTWSRSSLSLAGLHN